MSRIISGRAKTIYGILIGISFLFAAWIGNYLAGFVLLSLNKANPFMVAAGTYYDTLKVYLGSDLPIPGQKWKLIASAVSGFTIPLFGVLVAWVSYFTFSRVKLHGAARFAYAREVLKSGLLGNKEKKPSILLGKYRDQYLTFSGQEFVILSAPTRGGKGVGVVIPNCLSYTDSMVVLDVKGENYEKTSGFRAKHGQEVYVFQPFSDDVDNEGSLRSRSHRWNMLSYVSRNPMLRIGDTMDIAFILFPDEGNENDFFRAGARSLFLGLTLYLMETEGARVSVGEVFRYGRSNGTGKPLKEFLTGLIDERRNSDKPLSEDCINALADVIAMPDNTFGSVVSEFKVKLQPWLSPIVDAATAADDFSLEDVRKKRMTIYIVVSPNKLPVAAPLINVFFSQLINVNTKKLPEQDKRLKYQCLMLLDEFTAIGKVGILAKSVSYIAGYNMRLLPIIQSISQLESVYGKEDARTFVVNHAVKIVYPPRDQEDAEQCSRELGTYTLKVKSTGTSTPRSMFVAKDGVSDSENVSDNSRALLMPQELKEMSMQDPPPALIFYEKTRPILGEKIRYYLDPVFKARLMSPIEIPILDLTRGKVAKATQAQAEEGKQAEAPAGLDRAGVKPSKSAIESFRDVLAKKPDSSIEDLVQYGIGNMIAAGLLERVTAGPVVSAQVAPVASTIAETVDSSASDEQPADDTGGDNLIYEAAREAEGEDEISVNTVEDYEFQYEY
jgi:type IV secretion system protein VirD4